MRSLGGRAAALVSSSLLRACASRPPVTSFTEEEQMLVDSVRQFAAKEVKHRVREMDEKEVMEPALITSLFENGFMGIETPREFGGSGMTFFSSVLAIEELSRVDPSVGLIVDVHNTLVSNVFFNYCNDAQRAKYLPKLASRSVGCFCLTEPGSGSDAFALKCKVEKQGNDKFVIHGSKVYITNGGEADIFIVFATIDSSKGHKGITCFIVDKNEHPGVTVGRREKKMGMRASSTCEIQFDNVVVPAANVVGNVGEGYKFAIGILNEGRIGIGAQMVGTAQGALDTCMPYLFERKQFGTLLGDFQGMQFQYAQANTELEAARLLVYNAARTKLAGQSFVEQAAQAKLFSSQVAERVTGKAIELMGGCGYIRDTGVEKYYRDCKVGQIYEGTSNIQLHTLAKFMKTRYSKP